MIIAIFTGKTLCENTYFHMHLLPKMDLVKSFVDFIDWNLMLVTTNTVLKISVFNALSSIDSDPWAAVLCV